MAHNGSSAWLQSTLSALSQLQSTNIHDLFKTSDALVASFRDQLQNSAQCMLPSYTFSLPTGLETGTALALDLGGSTLRVAVIRLRRHNRIQGDDKGHHKKLMSAVYRESWHVSDEVKRLPAREFFDWITVRISRVLQAAGKGDGGNMSMGVTWSFPLEPTSAASGKVQEMGKGYEQWKTISTTDLKAHFDGAFRRRGLCLIMTALMNDTEATLLSHAYANPATRMSVIWGTGINAAVYLPVEAISSEKLGTRPKSWMRAAKAVVVNTEVSMCGKGIFPLCEADRELDSQSKQPSFQPLEQLSSGRYLGEICRLILLAGIRDKALFNGYMPQGIEVPFSFDTAAMSAIEEGDSQSALDMLMSQFLFLHPPSAQDILAVRLISAAIAKRAALYMAITLFSLHRIWNETVGVESKSHDNSMGGDESTQLAIAYCGAVVEKHPTARTRCQEALDLLMSQSLQLSGKCDHTGRLVLEGAGDSGLLGAAVGAILHKTLDPKL